jgi:hypothetical protein
VPLTTTVRPRTTSVCVNTVSRRTRNSAEPGAMTACGPASAATRICGPGPRPDREGSPRFARSHRRRRRTAPTRGQGADRSTREVQEVSQQLFSALSHHDSGWNCTPYTGWSRCLTP